MTAYAQIKVELKGVTYETEATDSAGILFLSSMFNEQELELVKQGRVEEARAMYSDREVSRLKDKLNLSDTEGNREKIEKELNSEVTLELWQRIERNPEIRAAMAKRIKELFRFASPHPLPEKVVFWYSNEDNGINLSAQDTMTLFGAIVQATIIKEPAATEPATPPVVQPIAPTETLSSVEVLMARQEKLRLEQAAITQQLALQEAGDNGMV